MIKKLTLSTIGACILAMGISAGAATVTSVVVSDFENSKVKVSGTYDNEQEIKRGVSVYIERVGGPGLTVGSGNAPADVMVMPTNTITKEDGTKEFEIEFVFNGLAQAGGTDYNVYAGNQSSPYPFKFIEKTATLVFADRLANNADEAQVEAGNGVPVANIYAQLQIYAASLGADIAFADTQAEQDYLAQNMWDYAQRIADKTAGSKDRVDEIKKIVDLTKAELEFMAALATTVAQTNVDYYVGLYATSAEIDVTTYSSMTNDKKTKVCGSFVGRTFTNMTTFRSEWTAAVANALKGGGAPGGGAPGGAAPGGATDNADKTPQAVVPPVAGGGLGNTGSALLSKYNDVASAEWAVEAMEYVVKNGIMQGTAANKFEPNTKVTREQVAKIIAIAFDSYNQSATSPFNDVPNGHWSASYIGSAYASGLLTGKSDTNFGLGEEMTREDLCTVMYRAAKMAGYDFEIEKSDFTDIESVSSYAQDAVKKLAGAKIISGMGDGVLAPKGTATRAQTAQMIMKLAQLLK